MYFITDQPLSDTPQHYRTRLHLNHPARAAAVDIEVLPDQQIRVGPAWYVDHDGEDQTYTPMDALSWRDLIRACWHNIVKTALSGGWAWYVKAHEQAEPPGIEGDPIEAMVAQIQNLGPERRDLRSRLRSVLCMECWDGGPDCQCWNDE